MSTPCAIGTLDPATGRFRGRHVDTDGHPSTKGPTLAGLIADADGDLARVLDVLTRDHATWSILADAATLARLDLFTPPGSHRVVVPGYGLAVPAVPDPVVDDWVSTTLGDPDALDTDVAWVYGFTTTDTGTADLLVLDRDSALRGRFPVAALTEVPPAAWYAVECGHHLERCTHKPHVHADPTRRPTTDPADLGLPATPTTR